MVKRTTLNRYMEVRFLSVLSYAAYPKIALSRRGSLSGVLHPLPPAIAWAKVLYTKPARAIAWARKGKIRYTIISTR